MFVCMSDDKPLYSIEIKTPVSPAELKRFTNLLESNGYEVITDLEYGLIRIDRKERMADEKTRQKQE